MSSSSSSSVPTSAPVGASTAYSALGHPAGFRPHATSDTAMTSEAGPRRSGRRRSTVTGPDRKRRLVNADGDVWSRQSVSGSATESGGRITAQMDSRSIPSAASSMRHGSSAPGASYSTPIDLSSSPPGQRQRSNDRRTSWSRAGNDYLEYIRPRWQPDSEVTSCPICRTPFSFWYRKHHCRKCGRVVCASCSPHRITIPRQFIVHPPDTNRSRASTLIPPRVAPLIDLEGDDSSQSPTALNPALGGGEEVRLCNPCVPDPNPEPPRGYTTIRAPGEPQSGTDYIRGGFNASTNQSRHRSYHSLSSPARHPPYASIPDNFSTRSARRTVGSSDYHLYGGFGGSLGSRFQERPMEYGSLSAARFAPSTITSGRPLPLAPGSAMLSAGPSFATSADQEIRLPISAPRRRVDERDLCPICDHVLPPLDMNRNEDAREAHIRQCIESHGSRARSSSHSSSPVAQSSTPVRMLAFTATEKDCLGHDGSAQECTICMEEYEVGQPLVRLECLCKFHKRCIVEWFERKKECPSPQLMEIDPRLRPGSDSSPPEGVGTNHAYLPSPATRQADPAPLSSHPTNDYPDPPSQISPNEQLHSGASTSSGPGYYGSSTTQPQSSHALYQASPGSIIGSTHRLESIDPNDPYAELKRPRACESCRQLKVRCEPDMSNPNASCKRCAKAGRSCVVTVPTRRRQKKTDSRVAELERKIDALTASLQASQGNGPTLQTAYPGPPREEHTGRRWLGPTHTASTGSLPVGEPTGLAGNKRRHSGEIKDSRDSGLVEPSFYRAPSPATEQILDNTSRQWHARPSSGSDTTAPKPNAANEPLDVIDRGLVSADLASEAFNRYVKHMAPHIPMVVFPPGTTIADIRKTKPVLLHAIIATAVGPIQPELQISLIEDFYRVIAERVVVKGEKSLDLIQGLLVTCNWYIPPDHFEELKFYQLTHMAVSLAMDIGMYRRPMPKSRPWTLVKDLILKKSPSQDPDSAEARRAWLGCYFLAVQVAASLRRTLLVRWTPYMDECVEILEKSSDALPSDKVMIQWAKLVHIIEDIHQQFCPDDTGSIVAFSEPKVQYTLKVFEKQLEQLRKERGPSDFPVFTQAEYIVNLYLHEGAMHVDYSEDQKSPGDDHSSPTSAAHMNALSTCLTSIHQAIDTICSVDIKDLISLPVFALARTSFTVVALIKLYSIVSSPETRIGQVIDVASLKTEYYLDRVIEHYTRAGEQAGGRTPAKFSVVLSMLRGWFLKRKDHGLALRDAFGGGLRPMNCGNDNIPCQSAAEKYQRNTGTTPLHLLSEVAMGEPQNRPSSGQGPCPPSTANYTPPASGPASQTPSSDLVSQPQPSLGPSPSPAAGGTSDSNPWAQYPAPTRQFYPPLTSTYQDIPTSGYPDPSVNSNMVMPWPVQGFFVPELGMQVGFEPENLYALENMLGDGFFNLPLPTEGSGYY
ncbi:hypothetical protein BDV27DRAFT_140948 [Aspergillus caelatus]|uniref:Zn(2)-C6 fungal-type domain-containing protein n=1 Tax=Aspergillus caelatus TaxID=61420 RepID=A0A5N7AJK1_9EURO|nr:uncharacterized protein BDV27DRAFT_140948 [Aspergillus caelatus]KAE8369853.1 hypothetical protein BDV27DRAFT_140948 [Aspergillus caelatus]